MLGLPCHKSVRPFPERPEGPTLTMRAILIISIITALAGPSIVQQPSPSEQTARQDAVVERGEHVMGFSHDSTTHHFRLLKDKTRVELRTRCMRFCCFKSWTTKQEIHQPSQTKVMSHFRVYSRRCPLDRVGRHHNTKSSGSEHESLSHPRRFSL